MKKLSAVALTSALILSSASVFTPSASPEPTIESSCSCSAPDGTCDASITCQGGCIAQCANNGDCYAHCGAFYEVLGMEATIQIQNGRYSQLVAELARISGRDVAFSPSRPDTVFNADYKRAILWDVLEMLSDRGTVQIAGQDFEKIKSLRQTLLSGERITLCVRGMPVNTFVNDMAGLTGLPLRITAGRPMAIVNVKLQNVTLNEILLKVSEQTGTKIIEEGLQ